MVRIAPGNLRVLLHAPMITQHHVSLNGRSLGYSRTVRYTAQLK